MLINQLPVNPGMSIAVLVGLSGYICRDFTRKL
jgi:hypothetical protein